MSWGAIYNRFLRKGHDHGSAAYEADRHERRAKVRYVKAFDALPYEPQGPEVCAIADAIMYEHRQGALGYDSATYMEAARATLNALGKAGFIVVPVPRPKKEIPS